jgi:REP element-mobilizing transposase RayT
MRLHGDPRRTVDRTNTEYGTPVLGFDGERWEAMKEKLKFPPRALTREQRVFIEGIIPAICDRGGWQYRVGAAGPDHVHVLLTSKHDPSVIRRLLKRWAGDELSGRWAISAGETWWAEGGSIRWVADEKYLQDVTGYVKRQREERSGRGRPGSAL